LLLTPGLTILASAYGRGDQMLLEGLISAEFDIIQVFFHGLIPLPKPYHAPQVENHYTIKWEYQKERKAQSVERVLPVQWWW
jgi:hypothetical protein